MKEQGVLAPYADSDPWDLGVAIHGTDWMRGYMLF